MTDEYIVKGRISMERTAWCGQCCYWHQESVRTEKHMGKLMRALGWHKTVKYGWLCPECSEDKVTRNYHHPPEGSPN